MSINIRQKGANGEREIVDDLNTIIYMVRQSMGLPILLVPQVQRNQNQSAVGGKDLVGTYGLAIEVKRQETLSINTWWAQCVASAATLKETPVLIYRQNRGKWKVIMPVQIALPPSQAAAYCTLTTRAEIDYETFKNYFRELCGRAIYEGIADGSIVVPKVEEAVAA